jgi:hypothetical protein
MAETLAHEVGHLFGLMHVNPLEGTGAIDQGNQEVMDYEDSTEPRFLNTVSPVQYKDPKHHDLTGVGHNPVYHLMRYTGGYSEKYLNDNGIVGGNYDTDESQTFLIKLFEKAFEPNLTLLEADNGEPSQIQPPTLYDVRVFIGAGEDSLVGVDYYARLIPAELADVQVTLDAYSYFEIWAASTPGGPLDYMLSTADPTSAGVSQLNETSRIVYLQQLFADGSFQTIASYDVVAQQIPEPTMLSLIALMGGCAVGRRRKKTGEQARRLHVNN